MKNILHSLFLVAFLVSVLSNASFAQLANWTQSSGTNFPTNQSGQIHGMTRIVQLKHHVTDSNRMYALTAEGGLFVSNDKANSWTVKSGTENLSGSCASLCIDYTNDQIIYLGAGDPNYYYNGQGLLKSTDGGNTFAATSLGNCLVVHILQNPVQSTHFVVATNKGIYKSTDNGLTWVLKTSNTLQFVDLKRNPWSTSQTLYACTKDVNPRLFKSFDFGETWTELTGFTYATAFTTGGARIGLTPADTAVVYYEVIGGGGIVHKSTDGGNTFLVKKPEGQPYINFYDGTNSNGLGGQGNYNNCIWVDRNNASHLWLQSHSTWESTDDGVTWTMLTHWASKIHTDMHQLEQAPFNDNLLISCNDGGIWFSANGGNDWTPKTDGIAAFEIATNAGVSSLVDKDIVSIGTQDNGRLYGNSSGWFTVKGGDDYAKRVADFNGYIYYSGNTRQLNGGGSSISYSLPVANWNTLAFNRTNANLAFVGENEVWRTTNLSSTAINWTQIANFGTSSISSIHSCVADPNRLYVLLSSGNIYVSNNALSALPTFVLYGLTGSAANTGSIAAMADNPDIVYVQKDNKVFRSGDGGQTWVNVTYNLPNVNHRRILAEQYGGSDELVFVATNNAVYYKKAGQTTWTNYSTNLPGRRSPTEFSMFDDGTNNAKIRYATYGRSMWETKFGNLRNLKASFDVAQTYYCSTNQPVQFKDASTGNPTTWSWSFPGGTPSSSNLQNPTVTYSAPGIYSAILTVSDGVSISSVTKTNLVLVVNGSPTANTSCSLNANSNLNNGFGIGISYFELGTIKSQTDYNDGQYFDYTCNQYTYLTPGQTYNATVTTGTTNDEGAKVFIDWNNNGNLESTEAVVSFPANKAGTRTLSFTVPTSGVQLKVPLRLRVLSKFAAIPNAACDVSTYGQAEDYMVYVLPVSSAVLSNGSGSSIICSGFSTNIKVNINGGVPPYTVVVSDGSSNYTYSSYISGSDITVAPTSTKTYSLVSVVDNNYYFIPVSGNAYVSVSPTTSSKTLVSTCDSYTWPKNNATYTSSGIYFYNVGCNFDTLVLTLNYSTVNTQNVSHCGNYTWPISGLTYSSSGTYMLSSTNAGGCPHDEFLNLVILNNSTGSSNHIACDSFVVGNQSFTLSGAYPITYPNAAGCDSVHTYNVSIKKSSQGSSTVVACDSIQLVGIGTKVTASGNYIATFSNALGCDSVHTYHVTIHNSSMPSNLYDTAYFTYTLPWGNTVTNTGTYSHTYTNANNCDSLVTIHVTIFSGVNLCAKVFLSGPYNTANGLMNDNLRTLNLIPTIEPYSSAPYNTVFSHVNGGGGETTSPVYLNTSGSNAIVDWVFIQLRDANDINTVVATKAALLQRDGDIVDASDASSAVYFATLSPGNYYVSVRHRNHLGVTTANTYPLSLTGTTCINFSSSSTPLFSRPSPYQNPSPLTGATRNQGGVRTLYAGNCNIDWVANAYRFISYNSLLSSDRAALSLATGSTATINGYTIFDLDMNGYARFNGTNPDRMVILSNCANSNIITVNEQTPN